MCRKCARPGLATEQHRAQASTSKACSSSSDSNGKIDSGSDRIKGGAAGGRRVTDT